MIQFDKLRLHGFKSFVERTELEIGPGLTGIVGPNGCGKSNLIEALRWNMGESSTKRMRGGSGSMEDVIFAGTENRPARNMAEASVVINNTDGTAPAPYNNVHEIEIVRRIERDHGSNYRINGKNVRARDVQLLYADLGCGASSPFLVSQGKITDIINARPHDRRMILEEAAGITGLHARRHEAELRLRATDRNLQRLEDMVGTMETRLASLKRQVRQANRYRNLSGQIRQLDVMIASLEYRHSREQLQEIESKLQTLESDVAGQLTVVTQLTKTQNAQAKDLPELRQTDAEMAAALQTKKLTLQRLEDDGERLESQIAETKQQIEQIKADKTHETQTLAEHSATLEKLDQEEKTLQDGSAEAKADLEKKENARQSLFQDVKEKEEHYTSLMEQTASDRAHRQNLEQQITADQDRHESVKNRLAQLKESLHGKQAEDKTGDDINALRASIQAQENKARQLKATLEQLGADLNGAADRKEQARNEYQTAESAYSKLEAEIETLKSVVDMYQEDGFRPVLEDIEAAPGFETALSRALGDTLTASTDENAPVLWESITHNAQDLPPLPDGTKPLRQHVEAPAALSLLLSQIGLVETEQAGKHAAKSLKPGQALVSKEGAYWRWDGLRMTPDAPDSHAQKLKQKNRLQSLKDRLPETKTDVEKAHTTYENATATHSDIQKTLTETRRQLEDVESALSTQRTNLNEQVEARSARQADLAKLEEALSLAEDDLAQLATRLTENRGRLAQFDDASLAARQQEIDAARTDLDETREAYQETIRHHDLARQEESRRKARLQAIGDERVNLQNRCIRGRERIQELAARQTELADRLAGLKDRPQTLEEEKEALLSQITAQETARNEIADKLAVAEGELADTTKGLKEAEAKLAQAREARAHARATVEERQKQVKQITQRIHDQFDMTPEDLAAEAALDPDALPDLATLKQQRDKAVRDRDMIGPVNLRADEEAQELEKELGGILNERNDLVEAIAELRQGIEKLNKEAREKLYAAFEHVNGYFREMFTRLFNGGKAHLSLIESDDPLEAGLEIFAQPPGKALQSLSLLSGGEQTLTAIALIFAMFLTNPAPICVMDEVDAPLDDSNVDRFCDLLEEFAEKGDTRFLLITHHRLTMARMDRLYGVTMGEKGVSQLVSVDLNQQLDFLDEAA